jgi:hypothetical protein
MPAEQRGWRTSIYGEIETMMQLEGLALSIEEACRAAQVSRAGYYRSFDEHAPRQAETELRDRIQRVALENRFYGYRRVAAELRRQGVVVNHKRVLRVMREDHLLSLRKRRFVMTTGCRPEECGTRYFLFSGAILQDSWLNAGSPLPPRPHSKTR